MATITPIFQTIEEVLTGTGGDDLFIVGSNNQADKYFFGGAGYDTLSIPYAIGDFLTTTYYPGDYFQNSVLVQFKSSFILPNYIGLFTDGIEALEFTDVTVNLLTLSQQVAGWNGSELNYSDTNHIVKGKFSTLDEVLEYQSSDSVFVPGHGNTTLIGSSSGNNRVFLTGFTNSLEFLQNGVVTTIATDTISNGSYTISGRNIDDVISFSSGASFFPSSGWYEVSSVDLNQIPEPEPTPETGKGVDIYRFFNVNSGVHFYTPSAGERDNVIANPEWGYQYEGVAYQAPSSGGTQLYRFFNAGKGYHFMTASSAEADVITGNPEWGYKYEGRSFNVSATETAATPTEVYRFYKPSQGVHFYSASADEANNVIANSLGGGYNLDNAQGQENLLGNGWGYVYEGIAWYAS